RGPLAAMYRKLVVENDEAVVPDLSRSGEDDLALGAMAGFEHVLSEEALQKLEAHVKVLKDPWFDALLLEKRADAAEATGLRAAQQLLDSAVRVSDASRLQYRSLQMRIGLITLQLRAAELEAARTEATSAWKKAEAARDWGMQRQLIELLAEMA